MTNVALAQVVRSVRAPLCTAEAPDFLVMIDCQARMLVNLARIVGEVLQGKESTHSLRLLDLEQRREELQRRNQAAVHSVHEMPARLDEIQWTMNALDRAAAGLFQIACGVHQLWSTPDEVASQMMLAIQKAIECLQHGYTRLADGSPVAEFDGDAAIGNYRSVVSRGSDAGQPLAPLVAHPQRTASGHALWLNELYGNLADIAHELADAGAILKSWSRQLSADLLDRTAGAVARARSRQQLVPG